MRLAPRCGLESSGTERVVLRVLARVEVGELVEVRDLARRRHYFFSGASQGSARVIQSLTAGIAISRVTPSEMPPAATTAPLT